MELKQYTVEEVAKCTGEKGSRCWIIIREVVYDVTDYLDKHPGGRELIAEYAGKDATVGFEDSAHSSDAKKLLKKYEIGVARKQTEKSVNEQTSKFDYQMKRENAKQRRKFLSIILGPCASA